jgi:hypothetical protein
MALSIILWQLLIHCYLSIMLNLILIKLLRIAKSSSEAASHSNCQNLLRVIEPKFYHNFPKRSPADRTLFQLSQVHTLAFYLF